MGNLIFLLPLVLLAWLFWSQRRRQQQMRAAQDEIKVGHEVSTTSGMLGTLVALDDEEGTIEVSPGVHVRFVRRAIVPRQQVGASPATALQETDGETPEPVDLDKHDELGEHDENAPETKAE